MRTRVLGKGVGLPFAVLTASLFVACSSSETAVATAPTSSGGRCQIDLSASSSSFAAAGGSGTIRVSTERDCTWTIASDVNWISISGAREGQGEASIAYTVAANGAPVARSGSISAGSSRVQLSQQAAPCAYSLSRSADTIGAEGGRLSFDVSTLSGCSWSAASDAGWLTIASGQNGNANGTVTVAVAANAGAARVGRVTVAGRTYTVTQNAAQTPEPPSNPPPPPEPPPPPPSSPNPVHIEGIVVLVSGQCPEVTFLVNLQRVATDRNTDYEKKGKCSDLRIGRLVEVDGIDTGSAIQATKITFAKDRD